jgi:hypothetical protein
LRKGEVFERLISGLVAGMPHQMHQMHPMRMRGGTPTVVTMTPTVATMTLQPRRFAQPKYRPSHLPTRSPVNDDYVLTATNVVYNGNAFDDALPLYCNLQTTFDFFKHSKGYHPTQLLILQLITALMVPDYMVYDCAFEMFQNEKIATSGTEYTSLAAFLDAVPLFEKPEVTRVYKSYILTKCIVAYALNLNVVAANDSVLAIHYVFSLLLQEFSSGTPFSAGQSGGNVLKLLGDIFSKDTFTAPAFY